MVGRGVPTAPVGKAMYVGINYGGQGRPWRAGLARELKLKTNGKQMLASLEKAGLI